MRLPRVRFTTRRLMILVALLALGLAGFLEAMRLSRASQDYRWRAMVHSLRAARYSTELLEKERFWADKPPEDRERNLPRQRARARAIIAHEERLGAKYDRAARYPWLGVEPDPPPPR